MLRLGADAAPRPLPPALIAAALATGVAAIVVAVGDAVRRYESLLLAAASAGRSSPAASSRWTRRPENHVGLLMVAIGLVWFAGAAAAATGSRRSPLTAGIWLGDLWLLPLAFLLAGFPLGRLGRAGSTASLVGALAVVDDPARAAVADVPRTSTASARAVPRNACWSADSPALADAIDTVAAGRS